MSIGALTGAGWRVAPVGRFVLRLVRPLGCERLGVASTSRHLVDRQLDLERRRLDLEGDLLPEEVLGFAVFVVQVLELQHLALAVGQAAVTLTYRHSHTTVSHPYMLCLTSYIVCHPLPCRWWSRRRTLWPPRSN